MCYFKIFTRTSTGRVRDVLTKRKRARVIPSTNNMIANIPAPDHLVSSYMFLSNTIERKMEATSSQTEDFSITLASQYLQCF